MDTDTKSTESPVMVSVKCLVFNHEKYLRKCLDGFVMQKTTFPFEVIVHDDASTDNSAAIIREYAERYPDIIKPIYETENLYSRRDGSLGRTVHAACSGRYIAMCEGDDFWTDELKLQKQFDALEAHPECTICTHITRCVDRDGNPMDLRIPQRMHEKTILDPEDVMRNEFTPPGWAAHTTSFFLRKEIADWKFQNPPEFVKIAKVGDLPLELLALLKGKMYFIKEEMSCYRKMSGGFNSNLQQSKTRSVAYWQNCIDYLTEFNSYTNQRYASIINPSLRRRAFAIRVAEKDYVGAFKTSPREFFKAILKKAHLMK